MNRVVSTAVAVLSLGLFTAGFANAAPKNTKAKPAACCSTKTACCAKGKADCCDAKAAPACCKSAKACCKKADAACCKKATKASQNTKDCCAVKTVKN